MEFFPLHAELIVGFAVTQMNIDFLRKPDFSGKVVVAGH